MAQLTVYAIDRGDSTLRSGFLPSGGKTYEEVRAGYAHQNLSGDPRIGQLYSGGEYFCYLAYLAFDTSSLPDDAYVTGVTLQVQGSTDQSVDNFDLEAREYDWDTELDDDQHWVNGADLGSYTLLAKANTSGYSANYWDLTEEGTAFREAINPTGEVRILLCSSRMRVGTAPTRSEYILLEGPDTGDPAPRLVIDYTIPVTHEAAASVSLAASASATGGIEHAGVATVALAASSSGAGVIEHAGAANVSLGLTVAVAGTLVQSAAASVNLGLVAEGDATVNGVQAALAVVAMGLVVTAAANVTLGASALAALAMTASAVGIIPYSPGSPPAGYSGPRLRPRA